MQKSPRQTGVIRKETSGIWQVRNKQGLGEPARAAPVLIRQVLDGVKLLSDAIPVKFQLSTPKLAVANEGGFQIPA